MQRPATLLAACLLIAGFNVWLWLGDQKQYADWRADPAGYMSREAKSTIESINDKLAEAGL